MIQTRAQFHSHYYYYLLFFALIGSNTSTKVSPLFVSSLAVGGDNNTKKMRQCDSRMYATSKQQLELKERILPSMIVFDLDDCLWSPEMYTLRNKPSIPVEGIIDEKSQHRGIVGMQVPRNGPVVKLFSEAREILQELVTNPIYTDITLGLASSSEKPTYSWSCLEGIEIVPGTFMKDIFSFAQIGRSAPLSSRKTTHFSLLQQESSIPYHQMLFYDDCNWGDHVADVHQTFGVPGQRTPRGLTWVDFTKGLDHFHSISLQRISSQEK
jgi:magnesium-dependent phosphatase 1